MARSVRLRGGTLWDGQQRQVRVGADVLVEDGRIAAVGHEALVAATSTAADVLARRGRTGRILPGGPADLVVVDDDPFHDVRALLEPYLVVREGRIIHPRTEPT